MRGLDLIYFNREINEIRLPGLEDILPESPIAPSVQVVGHLWHFFSLSGQRLQLNSTLTYRVCIGLGV